MIKIGHMIGPPFLKLSIRKLELKMPGFGVGAGVAEGLAAGGRGCRWRHSWRGGFERNRNRGAWTRHACRLQSRCSRRWRHGWIYGRGRVGGRRQAGVPSAGAAGVIPGGGASWEGGADAVGA